MTATRAPGTADTADFNASASDVSGGADVAAVNITAGAQVSFGTLPGGASFTMGTLTLANAATLTLLGGTSMTVGTADLGQGAGLDISKAWWVGVSTQDPNAQADAATVQATGAFPGPVSAIIGTLDLGTGATVALGDRNIGIGVLNDANSGSGNSYVPGAGFSGTGQIVPPWRGSDVAIAASIPAINFGTVPLGTTVTKTITIENMEGDAAVLHLNGAVQTDVNGANITDSDLSGSGVTPQNFSVLGRGGTDVLQVTLTANHLGALQGQAVNIAYQFNGAHFDQNVLVPITGTVVNNSVSDAACFVAGTRIATARGDLPVEALRPGDVVRTASGRMAPVRWVGLRDAEAAAPVRILADAVAPGVPARDLLLSPDHAVFIDGALIPAHRLVNGATVQRLRRQARVTYVHVELDRHDLLLTEGLASESYLDTGNRAAFDTWFGTVARAVPASAERLAATLATYAAQGCAPLLLSGDRVARAHRALLARARRLGWRQWRDGGPVLLADGRRLSGRRPAPGTLEFTLAPGTRQVALASDSFVPSELDPARPDGRLLGVAVALELDGTPLPEAAFGAGWHAPDQGCAWRWTDGAAHLHLPQGAVPARLLVRLMAAGGRYWRAPNSSRAAG